ncbi:MAG TPA: hypothetical protein VLE96_03680 [Chlamydiales bacterium]|nr:hypothetical protein [Chlamydiales bacterium]
MNPVPQSRNNNSFDNFSEYRKQRIEYIDVPYEKCMEAFMNRSKLSPSFNFESSDKICALKPVRYELVYAQNEQEMANDSFRPALSRVIDRMGGQKAARYHAFVEEKIIHDEDLIPDGFVLNKGDCVLLFRFEFKENSWKVAEFNTKNGFRKDILNPSKEMKELQKAVADEYASRSRSPYKDDQLCTDQEFQAYCDLVKTQGLNPKALPEIVQDIYNRQVASQAKN